MPECGVQILFASLAVALAHAALLLAYDHSCRVMPMGHQVAFGNSCKEQLT
jgi:hypothetical protein